MNAQSCQHRWRCFAWLIILSVEVCVGCGTSGPPRFEISGNVTVDGIPVNSGTIGFLPDKQTKGPATGGQITEGVYRIKASQGPVAGPHTVEIRGWRESGKPITAGIGGSTVGPSGASEVERIEMYIPAEYNTKTTLTVVVKPQENREDFQLKSR